jgi:hypothetical protein
MVPQYLKSFDDARQSPALLRMRRRRAGKGRANVDHALVDHERWITRFFGWSAIV